MPIYEYTCSRCAHDFETLVMSASEPVACESCGSRKVEKRFSVFGVGSSTSASANACEAPACPPAGCSQPQCRQGM